MLTKGRPAVSSITARQILLSMFFWGFSLSAAASDYLIDTIQFLGNKTTRDTVLFEELGFSAGMLVTDAMIDQGRSAIMALGLFSAVETALYPTEKGHELLITVREKHFLLIAPITNLSGDGDWTYGLTGRADNLLGLNQQLKASLKRKHYNNSADIEHESRLQINYLAPKAITRRLGIELGLLRERALLDEQRQTGSGRYQRRLSEWRAVLSAPLGSPDSYRGWLVSLGLQRQSYEHELLSGEPGLFFDGNINTVIGRAENKKLQILAEEPNGWHYGYELRGKITENRVILEHLVFYHIYQGLNLVKQAQIRGRARAGSCSESVFGDPCFDLGGDATIRGVRRGSIKGDAFVLTNTQLLVPLLTDWAIKGAVFIDAGAVYHPSNQTSRLQWAAGFGVGLIWKVQRFVGTDIRLEVARGIGQEGKNRVYAATSMLF